MHDKDPSTFKLARVGLGCFGVVSEVTLQCVPVHKLVEKTFVASIREVKRQHSRQVVGIILRHKSGFQRLSPIIFRATSEQSIAIFNLVNLYFTGGSRRIGTCGTCGSHLQIVL